MDLAPVFGGDELGEVLWVGCDDNDFGRAETERECLCGDRNIDIEHSALGANEPACHQAAEPLAYILESSGATA